MKIEKIIQGCIKHHRKSQEELYRQFYPTLYSLCKKYFINKEDILSAVNDGMLKVYTNIDQYDASKGNFDCWIYTVVRNTTLTIIRDSRKFEVMEFSDNMEIFDNHLFQDTSDYNEIYQSLDILPYTTRVVCSLFYLEEYSIKEIAQIIDVKEGTVKWHLHESRNRLKAKFNI